MRAIGRAAALLAVILPAQAAAQGSDCNLRDNQTFTRSSSGGQSVVSIRGPLLIVCGGGVEIRANEANVFENTRETHLFGNVVFQDREKRLTASTAIYSSIIGRLHATGDVVYTDRTTGSTLRGPEVEYYKVMPGRPRPEVIATQRPHLTLISAGGPAEERKPLDVDGDRISVVGEALTAVGSVVMRGEQLNAVAREAYYDRAAGTLRLNGAARVIDERFNLTGEEIQAQMAGGERLQRLTARGNARLEAEKVNLAGEEIEAVLDENEMLERLIARRNTVLAAEDLRVTAPRLHLYFARDSLQRMIAMRGTDAASARPVATAQTFRLEADSLDATLPGQQLRQVVAIGNARGETWDSAAAAAPVVAGDSAAAGVPQRDWIRGDTVTGFFAAASPGSAQSPGAARRAPPLERLLAAGGARSLYRVQQTDTATALPPLNYLAGEAIELTFEAGELDVARVTGLQRGIYLDPAVQRKPTPAAQPQTTPTPAAAGARLSTS